MKKFDMDVYTKSRIRELRGERVYATEPGDEVARYIERRLREIRELREAERNLDKSLLGCYTVSTMGDRDGES